MHTATCNKDNIIEVSVKSSTSTYIRVYMSCNHSYLNILYPGNVYIQIGCKRALNNFCKRRL